MNFLPAVHGTTFDTLPAGRWMPWEWGATPPYGRAALIGCPGCLRPATVGLKDHTIGTDGTVHPSFVCRHSGCRFHAFIRLLDWSAPA